MNFFFFRFKKSKYKIIFETVLSEIHYISKIYLSNEKTSQEAIIIIELFVYEIKFKPTQQKHRSFLKDKHKIPQSSNKFYGIKPKRHSS